MHQLISGLAFTDNAGHQVPRKLDTVYQPTIDVQDFDVEAFIESVKKKKDKKKKQATVQQETFKPVPASISNITAPPRVANRPPHIQERSLRGNWI